MNLGPIHNHIRRISHLGKLQEAAGADKRSISPAGPAYRLEFGEGAELAFSAGEIVKGLADVRMDTVVMLKKAIELGLFSVDAGQVAEKILAT